VAFSSPHLRSGDEVTIPAGQSLLCCANALTAKGKLATLGLRTGFKMTTLEKCRGLRPSTLAPSLIL
jgi:hypothetical protein